MRNFLKKGKALVAVLFAAAMFFHGISPVYTSQTGGSANGSEQQSSENKKCKSYEKSNTYMMVVYTGNASGDKVGMFAIKYLDKDGYPHVQYVDLGDDLLAKTMKEASEIEAGYKQRLENLKTLGYTLKGFSDEKKVGNGLKPLSSYSRDNYILTFDYEVKTVTSIEVITDIPMNGGNAASWDCNGIELYKLNKLYGLEMNGYYSNSMYLSFDGTLITKTVNSATISTGEQIGGDCVITIGKQNEMTEANAFALVDTDSTMKQIGNAYKDYIVEIDIADVLGAGIEALSNGTGLGKDDDRSLFLSLTDYYDVKGKLSQLLLPECLGLNVAYYDTNDRIQTITVPVVTSALGYAMERGIINGDTVLADFMGQGEKIFLKLRLFDCKGFNSNGGGFSLVYNNSGVPEKCGLEEKVGVGRGFYRDAKEYLIAGDSNNLDTLSISGIYIYEADPDENLKLTFGSDSNSQKQAEPLIRGEVTGGEGKTTLNPICYFKASFYSGLTVKPSSDTISIPMTSYNSGDTIRPSNTAAKYLVKVTSSAVTIPANKFDIKMGLSYVPSKGYDPAAISDISLKSTTEDYYGYWRGYGDDSTKFMNVGYGINMTNGNSLYAILDLDEVYSFENVSLTISAIDEKTAVPADAAWQVAEVSIYRIETEGLGERRVYFKDVTNGIYKTDRVYYRDFDTEKLEKNLVAKTDTDEVLLRPNLNESALISFSENSVTEGGGSYTNWREKYYSKMPYDITQQQLGFTARPKVYQVNVHTGTGNSPMDNTGKAGAVVKSNGDAGSSNFFYFQLVFENGTSGFVQANQQLLSDGFIQDTDNMFKIATNYDYGNLVAVNVIPDDSSSEAQPYDKLQIAYITVSCKAADGSTDKWMINTTSENEWVGIDYVEEAQNSNSLTSQDRAVNEYMTTYSTSGKTTTNTFLVAVTTGQSSKKFQPKTLNVRFGYTKKDGVAKAMTSGEDMIGALYSFTGESPKTDETGNRYLSDGDTMFRNGTTDYFIMEIDDISSFNSIEFNALGEVDCEWNVVSVEIAKIISDKGRKLSINQEYVLKGEYIKVTHTNEGGTMKVGTVQPSRLTMQLEPSTVPVSEVTAKNYTENRIPLSNNDSLNIAVFMEKNGQDYKTAYSLSGYVQYRASFDVYYHATPNFKFTEIDGQPVYYANGVGARNFSSISSLDLSAYYAGEGNGSAIAKYAIVQRIRNGVVVDTYRFECLSTNLVTGQTFKPIAEEGSSSEYQKVTLKFGNNTTSTSNSVGETTVTLQNEFSDVAVALLYESDYTSGNTIYQSPFIFLTDQGISTIGPNQLATLTFHEHYVRNIVGVIVSATGKELVADIESACIGTYKETTNAAKAQSEMTGTEDGFACTGWYSVTKGQTVNNGKETFECTKNDDGNSLPIVPVEMTFKTMDSNETIKNPGITESISMKIYYTGSDGQDYSQEFSDINDYLVSGSFETGQTAKIRFMTQDMEKITSIVLRCYDDQQDNTLLWGLEEIKISYGDGADVRDKLISVREIIYEENTADGVGKLDGTTITLSNITIAVTATTVNPDTGETGTVSTNNFAASDAPTIDLIDVTEGVTFKVERFNTKDEVEVTAGRSAEGDSNTYLSETSNSTVMFKPDRNTTAESITYTIYFRSKELPSIFTKVYVRVLPEEKQDPSLAETSGSAV